MRDRWNAGQVECGTGGMQDMWDAGQEGCRKGGCRKRGIQKVGMKERKGGNSDWRHAEKEDLGLEVYRKGYRKEEFRTGGVWNRGIQDSWDAGHLGPRTFGMQDWNDAGLRNAGKVECRNGGMLERMDAGLEGCSIGGMQYRRYAGQERFRTGGIPDSCNAGK